MMIHRLRKFAVPIVALGLVAAACGEGRGPRLPRAVVPGLAGKVMHAHFRLAGADYFAMDAGPQFPFTAAVSLYVACASQSEVDRYWDALIADGGQEQPCGWLVDRWGLSWQIIPDRLIQLIRDPDPERSHRAVQAMLGMTRIDIAALEDAADGVTAGG